MNGPGFMPAAFNAAVVLLLVRPVGRYLARSYRGETTTLVRGMGALERFLLRLAGISFASGSGTESLPRSAEMTWPSYLLSLLAFNGVLVVLLSAQKQALNVVYLRSPGPTGLALILEGLGSTLRGFASAATALTLLISSARGLRRRVSERAGNFWVDLIRGTLYILLPLALLLMVLFAVQPAVRKLTVSLGS